MASRIGRYGDLLQRGFVLGLLGLGGGAIALGVQTHREKLRRGQELVSEMDAQRQVAAQQGKDVEDEEALVGEALVAIRAREAQRRQGNASS